MNSQTKRSGEKNKKKKKSRNGVWKTKTHLLFVIYLNMFERVMRAEFVLVKAQAQVAGKMCRF